MLIVPIRFGASVRESVSGRAAKYVQQTVETLAVVNSEIVIRDIIWLPSQRGPSADYVSSVVERVAEDACQKGETFIVVDLGGPNCASDIYPIAITGAYAGLAAAVADYCSVQGLVLIPGKLDSDSYEEKRLSSLYCSNVSAVFSRGGGLGELYDQIVERDTETVPQLQRILLEAQPSWSAMLENAVVRVPGAHAVGSSTQITPFVYDFTNCVDVVATRIELDMREGVLEPIVGGHLTPLGIGRRDWFDAAWKQAARRLGPSIPLIRWVDGQRVIDVDGDCILVTPIARSFRSLQEKLIESDAEGVRIERAWAFAHISDADDVVDGKAIITDITSHTPIEVISGAGFECGLDFAIKMAGASPLAREIWSRFSDRYPSVGTSWTGAQHGNSYVAMSAAAGWAMMFDCGFQKERSGPSDRRKLPLVPSESELIVRNANFLAARLFQRCDSRLGTAEARRAVFFTLEDEDAGRGWSSIIERDDSRAVVKIDRATIDALHDQRNDSEFRIEEEIEELLVDQASQVKRLRAIHGIEGPAPVKGVFLDAFVSSGRTLELVQAALDLIDVELEFAFVVYDFRSRECKMSGIPVESCYGIEWVA